MNIYMGNFVEIFSGAFIAISALVLAGVAVCCVCLLVLTVGAKLLDKFRGW